MSPARACDCAHAHHDRVDHPCPTPSQRGYPSHSTTAPVPRTSSWLLQPHFISLEYGMVLRRIHPEKQIQIHNEQPYRPLIAGTHYQCSHVRRRVAKSSLYHVAMCASSHSHKPRWLSWQGAGARSGTLGWPQLHHRRVATERNGCLGSSHGGCIGDRFPVEVTSCAFE